MTQNQDPVLYVAVKNGGTIVNGYLADQGGFSDLTTRNAVQPHLYTFTFPGTSVSSFSLHMLDFDDLNPTLSTDHYVSMTAYNSLGDILAKQEITYTTPPVVDPQVNGDASAAPGQLGNWTWHTAGTGIVKVVLEFGVGFDPNIAFDTLSSTTECP